MEIYPYLILNSIFLCFKLFIIHHYTPNQRKIKFLKKDKNEPQHFQSIMSIINEDDIVSLSWWKCSQVKNLDLSSSYSTHLRKVMGGELACLFTGKLVTKIFWVVGCKCHYCQAGNWTSTTWGKPDTVSSYFCIILSSP